MENWPSLFVTLLCVLACRRSSNEFPLLCVLSARCLSQTTPQPEASADGNEAVNPTFVNRNPRNLEQMALAVKERGWKTTWPHREFYHRCVSRPNVVHLAKRTYKNGQTLNGIIITLNIHSHIHSAFHHFCWLHFCFPSSSGWSFLALSTTWLQRCSPAVLQSPCCPAQPKSGHWRRSWPPPDVWQHAKLLVRCWHSGANRRESPGWCTGLFPGRTVLMRWVYCKINYLNFFFSLFIYFFLPPFLFPIFFNCPQVQSFRKAMKDGGIILSEPRRKYIGTWI